MKLINADHLTMVDENEVDLHPYVRLAKQCREAPEVKAIPIEYIDQLLLWIADHHPQAKKGSQYLILKALKQSYVEDWRPWEK